MAKQITPPTSSCSRCVSKANNSEYWINKDPDSKYFNTWMIGDKSTGIDARGVPGLTPYIKDNYWWIGDTNTGVPATGTVDIWEPTEFNDYRFDGYKIFQQGDFHASEGGFAKLPNDGLLYAFRRSNSLTHISNDGAIYGVVSYDDGVTWGEPYLIYSDSYDQRNFVIGNTPNGDISIVFTQYDAVVGVHVGLLSIKSSNGTTWSTATPIDRTRVNSLVPFGKIFNRGTESFFVNYLGSGSEAHLYKSSNNGVSWEVVKQIYHQPTLSLHEPFLLDLPNGQSIILARSQNATTTDISIYQFSSINGFDFVLDGPTSINNDLSFPAFQPVCAEVVGEDLIVFTGYRLPGLQDTDAAQNKFRIFFNKWALVRGNPMAYILKHDLPRPYGNNSAFYGYPQVFKIGQNLKGIVTDKERPDRGKLVSNTNEKASLYMFDFNKVEDSVEFLTKKSITSGFDKRNELNESIDYVVTENDERGWEDPFVTSDKFIWRHGVPNPENELLGGNSRFALLGSFNADATGGYPQTVSNGGIVIKAQISDSENGIKWMLGRGASNDNQGVLFSNTYNSQTHLWSGWKALALVDDGFTLKPSQQSPTTTIERITLATDVFSIKKNGVFNVNSGTLNAPTPSHSYNIIVTRYDDNNVSMLAIATGGANYIQQPMYFTPRAGVNPWQPLVQGGTNTWQTRDNASMDSRFVRKDTNETSIQGSKVWNGSQTITNPDQVKTSNVRTGNNDNCIDSYTTDNGTTYVGRASQGFAIGGAQDLTVLANRYALVNNQGISTKQYRLDALNPAPTSATDTGTAGEIRVTNDYIYVCIATNTWVRTLLETW